MHTLLHSVAQRAVPTVFGPEGARGTWPGELSPGFAQDLGRALGHWAKAQGESAVMVGRDMRLGSAAIAAALQGGVRSAGVKIFDAGLCSAPVLQFGARLLGCAIAVRIGAGHDGAQRNGIEISHEGSLFDAAHWGALRERMGQRSATVGATAGAHAPAALQACYIERLLCDVPSLAGLRLVIDAGNGTAGPIACALFRALGCEVTELFCDPDESFPHHPPEPADPDHLQDLKYCLRYARADLGLAFDTDARRVAIMTPDGNVIGADQQLILLARDLLATHPGGRILCDAQSSRHVAAAIHLAGGEAVTTPPGRLGQRERLRAAGALLAADTAGHILFADAAQGEADGLYTAVRVLEIASRTNDTVAVLDALPRAYTTPELMADTGTVDAASLLESLASRGDFTGSRRAFDATGMRVEYADGFGMAGSADGTGGLVFRFEGDTPQALVRIQSAFRRQLRRVAPRLQLPF